MVDNKQTKIYDYSLYAILFAIIVAIAISFLKFMQFDALISRVIKLSLQKLIDNSKIVLPFIIAFGLSVMTSTRGHLSVVEHLDYLDSHTAALNVNNEEQLEYQKCPEIITFMLDRIRLINAISYSFLIFAGTRLTACFMKFFNLAADDLQTKLKLIFLTIAFSAILNLLRLLLASKVMPKIVIKDYNKIIKRASKQSH